MIQQYILDIIYIAGALSFVFGIKLLGKPESAKKGNFIAAVGMGLSVFGTIFLFRGEGDVHLKNLEWIFGGLTQREFSGCIWHGIGHFCNHFFV